MTTDGYHALSGDLTVILHYEVGELNVRADYLGTALRTERKGATVEVEFPPANGPFQRDLLDSHESLIAGWRGTGGGTETVYVIRFVQARVALGRGLGDEGAGNAEYVLIREAESIASSVVRDLLDFARVRDRQPWLLPPHMSPPIVGPARLINAAGETTRGYPLQRGVIVMLPPEKQPSGDMRAALSGDAIPEAESLLAEARWAVWPGNDVDTKRAVLLAAIALEVKAPQVLLTTHDETTRRLLDVLLARFDETPMSINFQVTALAGVVLGQSLKEHDGALAKRVPALYKLRNEIAHRGQTPAVDAARKAVATAEDTFAWLDSRAAA